MSEFLFEKRPWEVYIDSFRSGSSVPGAALLTMLEEDDDEAVEEAFQEILSSGLHVDLSSIAAVGEGLFEERLKKEALFVKNGMDLQNLDPSDPLRLYLEDLSQISACGDLQVLAEDYAAGSQWAANQLTSQGLGLVVEMAKKYAGKGVFLLDLIQDGSIGLWMSIQSFSCGNFLEYAKRNIQNALDKAVFLQAKNLGIGQKMRHAMQSFRAADKQLLMELGRNPSLQEIADFIHMTQEEAETVKKMLDDARLLEQAENLVKQPEPTQEDEVAVEDTAYFQMRQRISELLSVLDVTDAKILTLRFGLEKGLPMTPEDTGKVLGISTGEVNAREAAALLLLRKNKE